MQHLFAAWDEQREDEGKGDVLFDLNNKPGLCEAHWKEDKSTGNTDCFKDNPNNQEDSECRIRSLLKVCEQEKENSVSEMEDLECSWKAIIF